MLKGNMVGLRAIEKNDLDQLLEWRNIPELRQYFREYRELSMENQQRWYEKIVVEDQNTLMFAIIDLNTTELLGASGLCQINWVNRNADFSIYIGKNKMYIDSEYAIDAATILSKYSFEELGLHRLWAEIYDFDEPKKGFFERLGFTLEGRHRETYWSNGMWHGSLFYSILDREYFNKFRCD
ncbi:MAG: N-acetyltransferase [Firmicutes bacterium HGW-Firmicutes-15]|nr:MAG: N-acetyltransferase [Firmicutes bacterium HGW-Firmicutes-15]